MSQKRFAKWQFFMTVFVSLSILAGCTSFNNWYRGGNNSDRDYSEFITIDVFCSQANYQGLQSGWFADVVREKFNMEINIIAPNVAGGGDTLFQTRSAAGNIGDIIMIGSENGRLEDMITAGLMLDMSPYLESMSNVTIYHDALNTIKTFQGNVDGLYAIPSNVTTVSATESGESMEPTFSPYLRWDLYSAIGSPEMETLEDLLPVLKKMQDLSPQSESGQPTYGFSFFSDWDNNLMVMAKQPACFYGYDEIGFVLSHVGGEDDQSIIDDNSQYVRALKFFFDAYHMGLVDPDSPTQNWDTVWRKYRDGAVLFSPWPWLGQDAYNTTEHLNSGKGFMIAPINDMEVISYGATPTGNTYVVGIGSKAQDPRRMADFIDWLYSPEGIMMSTSQTGSYCGPEGLTWEMVDGQPVLTDFGIKAMLEGGTDMPESWGGGSWNDGVSSLNFTTVLPKTINPETGFSYDFRLWESYIDFTTTPVHKSWRATLEAETSFDLLKANNMMIVSPGTDFIAKPDPSNISTLRARIKEEIVAYSWNMVFAKTEDDFYNKLHEMQDIVIELGYNTVLEWDLEAAKAQNAAREKARQ